jgi:F-type H+-transporting ATPase subunit delta
MEAIASRYALALYKIASEDHALEAYLSALEKTIDALAITPELLSFLHNEFYSRDNKLKIIDTFFSTFPALTIPSLCKVMLEKRRIKYFKAALTASLQLIEESLKQQQGTVYSVTPLSSEQITSLETSLTQHLSKKITLRNEINLSLIGGMRIVIQGKVYDASIQEKLANLKQRLQQRGTTHEN